MHCGLNNPQLVGKGRGYKIKLVKIMEGYCVKCKAKKEMSGAKEVTMKGKGGVKRRAMTGSCPKCGTKMFKILGKA